MVILFTWQVSTVSTRFWVLNLHYGSVPDWTTLWCKADTLQISFHHCSEIPHRQNKRLQYPGRYAILLLFEKNEGGFYALKSKYYREGTYRLKGLRIAAQGKKCCTRWERWAIASGRMELVPGQSCERELGKSIRRWEKHVLVIREKTKREKKV